MIKSHSLLTFLFFIGLISSCRHSGCTDPLANNYDKTANKANDVECEYGDDEPGLPCGDSVEFCMEYGSEYIAGEFTLTAPDSNSSRMEWIDSTDTGLRSFEVTIYGNTTGTYVQKGDQSSGSFEAFFFNDQGDVASATSGEIQVNIFSVASGFSGNYEMTMSDSTAITSGHLNKVK
jgi:hypothetical protein